MMFMASANDLLSVFVTLEFSTLGFYVLVAYLREDMASNEAGIKFFILGIFAAALLAYGISLVYGETGKLVFSDMKNAQAFWASTGGAQSDLWKYDPATGNWTWMKGPSAGRRPGIYGVKGVRRQPTTPEGASIALPGLIARETSGYLAVSAKMPNTIMQSGTTSGNSIRQLEIGLG